MTSRVYDDFPASSYVAYWQDAICNDIINFYTNDRLLLRLLRAK